MITYVDDINYANLWKHMRVSSSQNNNFNH